MTLRFRIFLFNLVALITAFSVMILIGYRVLESTITESTFEKLNLIRAQKTLSLEDYFNDLSATSDLISSNTAAIDILSNFPRAKYKSSDTSRKLREYIQALNLLDILLVRADGTVVYSHDKEFKVGSSIRAGVKDPRFRELMAWSREASRGNSLFLDFAKDPENAFGKVSYWATPVFDSQRRLGILIYCISLVQIDQITNDQFSWSNHGLGETGETLLFAEDGSLRSTSRFSHSKPISLAEENLEHRLQNSDELQEAGVDYRGKKVFRSMGKVNLPSGDQWFMEVKTDEAEAFAFFHKLLFASGAAAVLICVIFLTLSYATTRQIMRPIQLLIHRLENLGTDNLNQKIDYKSDDEIGLLVEKYNGLAERLEKTTVSRNFVDSVLQSLKEFLFIVRIPKDSGPNTPYRISQANSSALEALKISESDVKSLDFRDLVLMAPDLHNSQWLLENHHSLKTELIGPRGHRIPILMNWSLLPEQRKDEHTFVFACTDIAETEANEKALILAREKAIKASLAKSEFLARMSHEIRTPLNAIIGMTEALEDSELNEEQKNMIHVSANAGESLLSLINDILDLSKIEAQEVVIEHIPFNIVKATRSVCEIFQLKAKSKGIEVSCDIRVPDNTIATGDPMRTRQILINLIGNALKFTAQGKIEICLEYLSQSRMFSFKVKDTGLGIPENKKTLIFKRFSQADSTITRRFGGTGLGLAICKNLVELMGGQIGFESSSGVGSSFFFSVPFPASGIESVDTVTAAAVVDLPKPALPMKLSALKKHLKILVVDDTEDNRFLIKAYLRKHDCEVLEAADGEQALDMVRQSELDMIFMDVQMPVLDGYAATQKIRDFEREQHRKPSLIVALSANAQTENIALSEAAGCNDYLTKPIKKATLYGIIERYFV